MVSSVRAFCGDEAGLKCFNGPGGARPRDFVNTCKNKDLTQDQWANVKVLFCYCQNIMSRVP